VGEAADELRADIERTRDEMASTVDAIGERLSPKLQAERQMERLRDKGVDPQRAVLIAGAVLVMFLFLRRGRSRRDG
jgi:Protein of unknown function (DUF3618)